MTHTDYAVVSSKLGVSRVLINGIDPPVTDSDARNFYFSLGVQIVCNIWDIVSSKRLPSQIKSLAFKLWIFRVKIEHEIIEVNCDLGFLGPQIINIVCKTKSSTDWLVYEENVGFVVPGVVVVNK